MSDEVYIACATVGGPEQLACERPKGHEGPHRSLIGREDEVEWENHD